MLARVGKSEIEFGIQFGGLSSNQWAVQCTKGPFDKATIGHGLILEGLVKGHNQPFLGERISMRTHLGERQRGRSESSLPRGSSCQVDTGD